jgi:hypothetical protein
MTGARLSIVLAVGLWAIAPSAVAQPMQRDPGCSTPQAEPDRLQGLTSEGDLRLASGRLAKLSGIRLPDEAPYRDEALSWLRARIDRPVLVQGSEQIDRWNRMSLRIRPEGEAAEWSRALVEAGLAIVDAGLDGVFCQPELLALEAFARQRRLGVWADDRYKPLDVSQPERLRDRTGRFVLVEGRVRSIGERAQRTYLNFGGLWAEDFTIIIPRKIWKRMSDRGMGAEALKGRRIRARGILQPWQGTAFSIVIPDMIERLEGDRLPR